MRAVTLTAKGALKRSALRQTNERLVLNTIRENPLLSRADIVRITGLAPSSVTYIVERLLRGKLACEEEIDAPSHVGRRPTGLRIHPRGRMVVAVEVVKPEARVVLSDLNGDPVRKKTVPWHPNYEVFLDRIHSSIEGMVERLAPGQVLGVGVGLPGTIERTSGRVIAAENLNWFDVEAGSLLRGALDAPFYFENSAKLAARSEMWLSECEGKPLRDFVFITVVAGLGTGVVINGQVVQGAHSTASEFGHVMLYADGRRCSCGNSGCWEQYASDIALRRLYAELSGKDRTGEAELEPSAIVAAARHGDIPAVRAVEETARHFGLGFVNLIMALDPEAIVVGDWLAEAWDLFEETIWNVVRSRIAAYYLRNLRIVPCRTSTDYVLSGATALVLNRFFNSFEQDKPAGRTPAAAGR